MMRTFLESICTEHYKEHINKLVHLFSCFSNFVFFATQYQKRTGLKPDGKSRNLLTDWITRDNLIVSTKDLFGV
jgi:hypothetical protein